LLIADKLNADRSMTDLLTVDEEVELGRRVRAGDIAARNELVERNWSLAMHLANSYGRRCRCRETDLSQSALLGLVRGANAYDPDRHPGKKFATIARYYVRLEILGYLYGRQLIRIPHSARPAEMVKRPVKGDSGWYQYRAWTESAVARAGTVVQGSDRELNYPDPSQSSQEVDDSRVKNLEQLRSGLEKLPPWQAEVLRRHFGLHGRAETVRSIAREAGLSTQAVFAIQRSALKRLRVALSRCTA
jgi:RNA polymerase sigma factor (sigma-70 family)